MKFSDFRRDVVRPTLEYLEAWSPEAEELVIGTIAVESAGKYRRQLGGGPALGVCQMEPATHKDIWKYYLRRKGDLKEAVQDILNKAPDPLDPDCAEDMVDNDSYAVAMCRCHYLRKPGAIPTDLKGQAAYWKKYYNTHLGAGTVEKYIAAYATYVEADAEFEAVLEEVSEPEETAFEFVEDGETDL